jgi:hypothetical protein
MENESPERLPDAYVPPTKFVQLLKRLETRRKVVQDEPPTASSRKRAPAALQHEPSPTAYEEYQVMLRTAPARVPGLRPRQQSTATAGQSPRLLPADEGEFGHLLDGANDDMSTAATQGYLRHDHAVDEYSARRQRVDELLNRERPMDFYEITAENDAKAAREAPPPVTLNSNYDAIASILGLGRNGLAMNTLDSGAAGGFDLPAEDLSLLSPGAKALKAKTKQARNATVTVVQRAAYEPSEFAAMRAKVHDLQADLESLTAEHERRMAEAALHAELKNKALRVEIEQRVDELEAELESARDDTKRMRTHLEEARSTADRMRFVEQDSVRLQQQLLDEKEARRRAEATVTELRMELEFVPSQIADACVQVARERDDALEASRRLSVDIQRERDTAQAKDVAGVQLQQQIADLTAALADAHTQHAATKQLLLESAAGADALRDEVASLEAIRGDFAAIAERKLKAEIDASRESARVHSQAYDEMLAAKTAIEAEAVKLREGVEIQEVQRKTLKRMHRDMSQLQEQLATLHASYKRIADRRMHHVCVNVALKLQLSRFLRPNGIAERLMATEAQCKWLFAKLDEASALAQRRLRPTAAPVTRLIARLDGDESNDGVVQLPTDPAPEGSTYVYDATTQTEREEVADAAFSFNSPAVVAATLESSRMAASFAASVRESAAVSIKMVPTSFGAGRLTPSGESEMAPRGLSEEGPMSGRREDPPSARRQSRPESALAYGRCLSASRSRVGLASNADDDEPVPATLTDARFAANRTGSAASSTGQRRRAAAGGSSRPMSAMSFDSTAQHQSTRRSHSPPQQPTQADEPPAANFLVKGTKGPSDATLATNPYNYFSEERRHVANGRPFSSTASGMGRATLRDARVVAPDWLPTSYAVGSLPLVMSLAHEAGSVPRLRAVLAPQQREGSDAPPQGRQYVRSDDPEGAADYSAVTALNAMLPIRHPTGAWHSKSLTSGTPL